MLPKSGACAPLPLAGSSNVYRMRREHWTRFNLTTTSSRQRPSTNSRKRKRRKSRTSNAAPVREPHTFFSVRQPWASLLWLAISLLASGNVKQNPGPQKKLQLTGLVWLALRTRHLFTGLTITTSFTPGDLWSSPVVVADLLQIWMDAQGATRGGTRSCLNWDWTGLKLTNFIYIDESQENSSVEPSC